MSLDPMADDELRRVFGAATRLLQRPNDLSFAQHSLEVLADLLVCEVISYNEVDLPSGQTNASVTPGHWEPLLMESRAVYEASLHDHPVLAFWAENGGSGPLRFEDVIDDAGLLATDFYTGFLAPLGLRYQMVLSLPSPAWKVVGYAFNRVDDPFTDREVQLIEALTPHLVEAYQHANAVDSSASFAEVLADSGWRVVVVDELGVIQQAEASEPPFVIGNRLAAPFVAELESRSAEFSEHAASWTTTVDDGEHSWQIQVNRRRGQGHLLLVRRGSVDVLSALGHAGCTTRQAEVAKELLAGGTNDRIARRLDISIGTVKKHLEAVYRILDVQDRSTAVAKIAGLVQETGGV